MNINKHLFRSLAVAAATSVAAANASADVVAAVTASGNYTWSGYGGPIPIPFMVTPSFNHSGGPLVAMYSAECSVNAEYQPAYGLAFVDVDIQVLDGAGAIVATLSPSGGTKTPFCSSSGVSGFNNRGSFATTGVGTLPAGVYRVRVGGQLNIERATALMGARSLVVLR